MTNSKTPRRPLTDVEQHDLLVFQARVFAAVSVLFWVLMIVAFEVWL